MGAFAIPDLSESIEWGQGQNQVKIKVTNSVEQAGDWARLYLSKIANSSKYDTDELAVVFDIDDTVLTRLNSGRSTQVNSMIIEPMKKLYDYARILGFTIYFVTARPDFAENLHFTKRELYDLGYTDYRDIFMMPSQAEKTDTVSSEYKRKARHTIETRDGKTIVLNLGDRWSDLILFPNGDRKDQKLRAHNSKPDTLIYYLYHQLDDQMTYIASFPDTSWFSVKLPG